jgi:hypothetical protein
MELIEISIGSITLFESFLRILLKSIGHYLESITCASRTVRGLNLDLKQNLFIKRFLYRSRFLEDLLRLRRYDFGDSC